MKIMTLQHHNVQLTTSTFNIHYEFRHFSSGKKVTTKHVNSNEKQNERKLNAIRSLQSNS